MGLLKEFFEYYGNEILEKPYGFVTYQVDGEECHITELFISEKDRGDGKALEICQETEKIARERGCKFLTCEIWPKKHTISHTNWLLLRYMRFGFSVVSAKEGAIELVKGLGGK